MKHNKKLKKSSWESIRVRLTWNKGRVGMRVNACVNGYVTLSVLGLIIIVVDFFFLFFFLLLSLYLVVYKARIESIFWKAVVVPFVELWLSPISRRSDSLSHSLSWCFLNLLIEWGRYSRGVCSGLAMMNVGSLFYYFLCFFLFSSNIFLTFSFLSFYLWPKRSLSLTLRQEETDAALMIAVNHI